MDFPVGISFVPIFLINLAAVANGIEDQIRDERSDASA